MLPDQVKIGFTILMGKVSSKESTLVLNRKKKQQMNLEQHKGEMKKIILGELQ